MLIIPSSCSTENNVHCVRMNQLFMNYEFQIEMFERFKSETIDQGEKIDSLNNLITQLGNDSVYSSEIINAIAQLKNQIITIKKSNTSFKNDLNKKIYSRINSGLDKFCKENNIKILLNSDERTSVLFNDSIIDITKELTNYLNDEYQGI